VRGARLMASGIPLAAWNNADLEAAHADLDAVVAWYASRAVPWGIRVPVGLTVDLGTPLFVKRCFGLLSGDLKGGDVEVATRIVQLGPADLSRLAAAEAAVFGVPAGLASRWIAPVLGVSGFTHWLAHRDGRAQAVATTVASAGDAGPAVMVTGLGSLPGADPRLTAALARVAIRAAIDLEPAAIVHTYGDPDDDPELYRQLGFTEVDGLQVRLVNNA
jgi:hypothetical protein